MKLTDYIRDAIRNLTHSKLRSLLALLGVLVGTASVVAMVSSGELATREALKQFKSLGTDLLAVSLSSSDASADTSRQTDLSLTDALALSKHPYAQENDVILDVAPYTQVFHPVVYQGQPVNSMILGVSDEFTDVLKVTMAMGRSITLADKFAYYCVIGQKVYEDLKAISYKNPIGQIIRIGSNNFTIVGIANTWPENNFVYTDINTSILIPIMTSTLLSKYAVINNLVFKLVPDANIEYTEKYLRDRINVAAPDHQVSFRSAKELIAKMQSQSDIMSLFLGLIGSISLFVGGIGVMNIMLVSVIERRREIGIRRAVGARRQDITRLFLIEAVMLSMLGGIAGVVIGMLITYSISVISGWEFTLLYLPAAVGFLVSVVVGIISGLYPAWRASRLSPIDALRSN